MKIGQATLDAHLSARGVQPQAMTDLAALLDDPVRAKDVPSEERQAALDALAVHEGRCRLVRELLTASLATPVPQTRDGEDELVNVREAARIAQRSPSWLRKNGHTLPGFRQPGGKGTRVAWSLRALEEWASTPTS